MATVDFSSLTIPTPVPFDQAKPDRNREDACYVFMQAMAILRDSGALFDLPISVNLSNLSVSVNLSGETVTDLIQAILDLQYNGAEIELPNLIVKLNGIVQDVA